MIAAGEGGRKVPVGAARQKKQKKTKQKKKTTSLRSLTSVEVRGRTEGRERRGDQSARLPGAGADDDSERGRLCTMLVACLAQYYTM